MDAIGFESKRDFLKKSFEILIKSKIKLKLTFSYYIY